MRLSVVLLLVSLAGVMLGGWLIGMWALGVAVIFDSLCVGAWALLRETGTAGSPLKSVPTVEQILDRARAS